MNLWSGSREGDGLAAALTNPTEISRRKGTIARPYRVLFRGRVYADAEAAYLSLRRRDDLPGSDELMVAIVRAKLAQHPELGEATRQRAGVAWIGRCQHFTWAQSDRFRAWEGHGLRSRFLRNLAAAYAAWVADPSVETDA